MSKSISYTTAEEMRRIYNSSRITTIALGKKFGVSQPRTSQIVTAKHNPILPTAEERKRFGIKWKKPKKFVAQFKRGNQTYYLLEDKRIWHYQKQCFTTSVTLKMPPKVEGVKRKRYDADGATFAVYEDGRIWSFSKEKFLTLSRSKSGTYAPGKIRIARLILTLFDRPSMEDEVARHLDGDANHNHINNLEWGSHQDNVNDQIVYGSARRGKRASNARLKDHEAEDILQHWQKHKKRYDSMNAYAHQVSDDYNITPTSVYNLLTGTTWKHLH